MSAIRLTMLGAVAAMAAIINNPVCAADLVYGSWTPAREYQNRDLMPEMFKKIEKDTNGAIKWKLVAGGQLADGKTTFTGRQGRADPGRSRHRRPMCRTPSRRCTRSTRR